MKKMILSIAAATFCMVPALGAGVTNVWVNANGGDWNEDGNWSANVVPGVGDYVYITNDTPNDMTVYYNQKVEAVEFYRLYLESQSNKLNLYFSAPGFRVDSAAVFHTNTVVTFEEGADVHFGMTRYVSGCGIKGKVYMNGGTATFENGDDWMNVDHVTILVGGGILNLNSGLWQDGTKGVVNFETESELVISGGRVNVGRSIIIGTSGSDSHASVKMTGGTLVLGNQSVLYGKSSHIIIGPGTSRGKMEITGGSVTNHGQLVVGNDCYRGTSGFYGSGKLDMTGGYWHQRASEVKIGMSQGSGTFNFTGGEFVGYDDIILGAKHYNKNLNGTGYFTVGGGFICATNVDNSADLRVDYGTVTVTNGTLVVDNLVATNGANSKLKLHGGSFTVKNASNVSNKTVTVLGDGTLPFTVTLGDGTHRFFDGLKVSANATLALGATNVFGTATIDGDVVFDAGAQLAIDADGTANDVLTVLGKVTLPSINIFTLTGAPGAKLPDELTVMTARDGIVGDVGAWPSFEVASQKYRVRRSDDGTTLSLWKVPKGICVIIR